MLSSTFTRNLPALRTLPRRSVTSVRTFAAAAPFPDDIPTHPLLVVDYKLLQDGAQTEKAKLWEAATKLGFWYLKNHGTEAEVDAMFEMGAETMDLPLEEKMKYEQGDAGSSFGYKAKGANATDETGRLDTVEFINVAKDDALSWPRATHRTYPSTVNARMQSTIQPFVHKALDVNNTLLGIFNEKLELPLNTLGRFHTIEEPSGSEARVIKRGANNREDTLDEAAASIGAHTDFGSLSFLHNRLGGLQVLVPGTQSWQYIRPIPGHAICNVGDAMAILSGGLLRSNLHRVVPPPGAQGQYTRWSLVYFTRPGYSTPLNAIADQSPIIKAALEAGGEDAFRKYVTGHDALAWFSRRIKNQRIANRTGPETWRASRGTEHKVDAV